MKQREIDLLYEKLLAASTLTDAEMQRSLPDALDHLVQGDML